MLIVKDLFITCCLIKRKCVFTLDYTRRRHAYRHICTLTCDKDFAKNTEQLSVLQPGNDVPKPLGSRLL